MANRSELVDIDDVTFVLETPGEHGAFLVKTTKDRQVWIPKSQCERNDDGSFTMERWIAEDKGLV